MLDTFAPEYLLEKNSAKAAPSAPVTLDMADLTVAYLEQLGVEYIFGIPGGAIEPFYNAVGRNERRGGKLRQIVARHEAGAAFMADGYARETGKIGVCVSTSGPGATNLITAVASAYANDVPMLVLTGQPQLPTFGKHSLQESSCTGVDVLGMFRHCTRYNSLVSHADQMEHKLMSALQHATRSPRGPVHLSVPMDVFRAESGLRAPTYDLRTLLRPHSMVDDQSVQTLCSMLTQCRNVVLLIGGGCGDAIQSILQFAAIKGATFVTTPDGMGLVSPQHPLFRGVFGYGGHLSAEMALREHSVDLILAVGTSMGEWKTGGWCDSLMNERLVHIDESEEHLARTPMAKFHMRGSISAIFSRLVARSQQALSGPQQDTVEQRRIARQQSGPQWNPDSILHEPQAHASDATPIKPQRLMRDLSKMFPINTRYLADTGNSVAWATHYLQPQDRRIGERRIGERKRDLGQRKSTGGWLRVTTHFAAMGWAIGAAVGTAAANPDVPVVCITGDGSMLMSGQELSAAVAENLTVVFVVLNDSAYGMVKHGQRLGGAEQIGYALPRTDFAMLARALGAQAFQIHSPEDMAALDIEAICRHPGPTLLDVYIDAEEVPPMSARIRVLGDGQ